MWLQEPNLKEEEDDAEDFEQSKEIGLVGLANMSVLTLIVLLATLWYIYGSDPEERSTTFYKKRVLLHVLLIAAVAVDLPMYTSFLAKGGYEQATYAFHKLETAFMFGAYSIIVSEWCDTLYEIQEDAKMPFLFKKGTLLCGNVIVIIIGLLNFIWCLASRSLDDYVNTPIYTIGIVCQLVSTMVLTIVLLHGGLKLSWRIQGASGIRYNQAGPRFSSQNGNGSGGKVVDVIDSEDTTPRTSESSLDSIQASLVPSPSKSKQIDERDGKSSGSNKRPTLEGQGEERESTRERQKKTYEFLQALRILNIVMATCVFCNVMAVALLCITFVTGNADSAEDNVGPKFFYWTFYHWLPIWGPILSLLYLAKRRDSTSRSGADMQRDERLEAMKDMIRSRETSTADTSLASEQFKGRGNNRYNKQDKSGNGKQRKRRKDGKDEEAGETHRHHRHRKESKEGGRRHRKRREGGRGGGDAQWSIYPHRHPSRDLPRLGVSPPGGAGGAPGHMPGGSIDGPAALYEYQGPGKMYQRAREQEASVDIDFTPDLEAQKKDAFSGESGGSSAAQAWYSPLSTFFFGTSPEGVGSPPPDVNKRLLEEQYMRGDYYYNDKDNDDDSYSDYSCSDYSDEDDNAGNRGNEAEKDREYSRDNSTETRFTYSDGSDVSDPQYSSSYASTISNSLSHRSQSVVSSMNNEKFMNASQVIEKRKVSGNRNKEEDLIFFSDILKSGHYNDSND